MITLSRSCQWPEQRRTPFGVSGRIKPSIPTDGIPLACREPAKGLFSSNGTGAVAQVQSNLGSPYDTVKTTPHWETSGRFASELLHAVARIFPAPSDSLSGRIQGAKNLFPICEAHVLGGFARSVASLHGCYTLHGYVARRSLSRHPCHQNENHFQAPGMVRRDGLRRFEAFRFMMKHRRLFLRL